MINGISIRVFLFLFYKFTSGGGILAADFPPLSKRKEPAGSDNQVIEERNAEQRARFFQAAGDGMIFRAGYGLARCVIMSHHNGHGTR